MTIKDNTDQTPEDEHGREENKDAPKPHIHSPDCEHCSDHEELTDEDEDDEGEEEGEEEEEEVDIMDEDIVIDKSELASPLAAMFTQFLNNIVPDDIELPKESHETTVRSLRLAYMAGAIDLMRLQRNGAVIVTEAGSVLQHGYSFVELEAEVREELGIDEVEEGEEGEEGEDEDEICDETKSVMKNIISGKLH